MAGLLNIDFQDPEQAGLLALAQGLFAAGAPQTRRVGIGEALTSGLAGMSQAKNQAEMLKRKKAEQDLAMQMQQMQLGQMQGQMQDQESARQRAAMMPEIIRKFGNDYQGMIRAGIPADFVKSLAESQNYGKSKVARVEDIGGAQGEKLRQMYDEYGNPVGNALAGYVAPEKIDLGNKITFATPQSGMQYAKGFSPSDQITMRGQNMTDARAREINTITRQGQQTQVINDPAQGLLLVDKGTGLARKATDQYGRPISSDVEAKKVQAANAVAPVIESAKDLIKGATGSYSGMAFDKAAQFFGGATKGAENIAKLKVLEGQLMMSQPRMEGPQSDKDVAMYRQMAGQIGDPTVPASLKMAALNEIEKLNQRYSTNKSSTQTGTQEIDFLLKKYGAQ